MCSTGPRGAPSPPLLAFSMGGRRGPTLRLRPPRAAGLTTPPCAESRGFRVSASAAHEGRTGRSVEGEQLPPPGPRPPFSHPLPQLPGCHLTRRQPPARRGGAGQGREGPDGGRSERPGWSLGERGGARRKAIDWTGAGVRGVRGGPEGGLTWSGGVGLT